MERYFVGSRRRLAVVAGGAALASAAALWLARPALVSRPPDAAAQRLERARTPDGMVYVPGGQYISGSDDRENGDEDRPLLPRFVPSFYIDRTEVTNAQFRRFRPAHTYPAGDDTLPVTNVTYDEAAAYAAWEGKRLPTEDEWEKAARGVDGRLYPWGNAWDAGRIAPRRTRSGTVQKTAPVAGRKTENACLIASSRASKVGSFASGASPYGCVDMAGNAWEWVSDLYRGNPEQRILRGGAAGYGELSCRTYTRGIEGAGST